jgi:KaiC/GvpD/RAD55 family RecA-like ATPase
VELLASGQTIIAGVDRVIINDQEPIYYSAEDIKDELKLIATFSELYEHSKDLTNRNDFYFKLGGALARHTEVPMHLRIKYVKKLCELTGDDEVGNRIGCIERQQENFKKNPDEVFGMKELSEFLGTNLKFFDLIKREEEKENTDTVTATGLEFLNGHEFTIKDFPKPQYILWPIVAKQQIRQVFAQAGTGKTLMMLHEACAVASGHDFLHFKNEKQTKTPVLYVEGEMDSSSIQDRLNDIESTYERENKILNKDFLFFATMALQKDMYFHSITAEVGRLNVEITAKKVEEITGIKPVIYLDNITALTVMQEKEGADWVEMMHWLSRLRNRGYHVTFLHHPTKTGETASGSNIKERSIDINMKLSQPDEKTIIEDREEGHTQIIMEFLKWREHMNTFHSKKRIAVLSRSTGKWEIFPMLNKTQRSIYQQLLAGKKADDIISQKRECLKLTSTKL